MWILLAFIPAIAVIWHLPALLLPLLGFDVKLHIFKGQEATTSIRKNLKGYASLYLHDGSLVMPHGFVIGRWYVGYISESAAENKSGFNYDVYLLASSKFIQKVTENKVTKGHPMVDIAFRRGNWYHLHYDDKKYRAREYQARESQRNILDRIKESYLKQGYASVFVHGHSGSGKSALATLLTLELKGTMTRDFNPTHPSDTIASVREYVDTNTPLIVLLDEFDVLIRKAHEGFPQAKSAPIAVNDKSTMNKFLDTVHLYNIILIATSNTHPEEIKKLDPCYLRSGRFEVFELN
jgi:hypothetical protein